MFETDFENAGVEPPTQPYRLTRKRFAVWLLAMFAGITSYTLWLGYSSWADARVAPRERTSMGIITSVNTWGRGPDNWYRFSFAGITYDGTDGAYPLEVGKRVTIYLDAGDPTTNSLTRFSLKAKQDHDSMISTLYVSAGLAIASAIAWAGVPTSKESEDVELL
jgi:hypothetical protein